MKIELTHGESFYKIIPITRLSKGGVEGKVPQVSGKINIYRGGKLEYTADLERKDDSFIIDISEDDILSFEPGDYSVEIEITHGKKRQTQSIELSISPFEKVDFFDSEEHTNKDKEMKLYFQEPIDVAIDSFFSDRENVEKFIAPFIPIVEDGYTPKKGVDYDDGYTPRKGVDYNDGRDGVTPEKGVDYFTEKEIDLIKKSLKVTILKELPKYISEDEVNIKLSDVLKKIPRETRIEKGATYLRQLLDVKMGELDNIQYGFTYNKSTAQFTLTQVTGGGGGGTWGSITGTLADQTDLQAALDGKEPAKGADDNYVTDAQKVIIAATTASFTTADETKLDGIEAGAEVNNISDANVTDLTDGGNTTLHTHDSRYYTESEIDTLISNYIPTSQKGASNGVAELDSGGKVPSAQLPAYVDDVLEYANFAALPGTGATGIIYVTLDTNLTYRWSGSVYVEISASLALGETSSTAYRGDRGKTAYDHSQLTTGNPHNVLATQITDFDTEVANNADVAANTAKQTNATHTGDVTGATALTIDKTAITGKTAATAVGTDYVLISDTSDSGNLKKALVSDFAGSSGATTALDNLGSVAINTSLISDTNETDDLGSAAIKWLNLFVKNIGATATRVTKGWFTDLEVTNPIAGSVTGNASTVTTNANLTGPVTSVGNATAIADAALSIAKTSGLQSALDLKAPLASPTFTGTVTVPTPSNDTDASTKAYVDAVAQGLSVKSSVILATAVALPTNTYLAGVITITATGTLTVDGTVTALNDRILVKDEASALKNGIYKVTTAGAIGVAAVLTRSTDMDIAAEFPGAFVFVEIGTVNAAAGFVCTNSTPPTVGTTAITFTQFSGAGQIIAGNGISKSGNTLSIDTAVTVDKTTAQTLTNKTLTSPAITTPTGIVKGDVGLGNVANADTTTTANITDSSNKRFITDAQQTVLGNTSGTNSGNETTTTVGALINGATAKTTPVDADYIGLMDSAASNILKKLSWLNIKATLKTYFDTLYQAAGSYLTSGGALGTPSSGTATNLTGTASGLTAGDSTKIGGITVTGTPAVGHVPTATSTTAATWQAPSGGAGWVTIGTGTLASANATLMDVTSISSTYDTFRITICWLNVSGSSRDIWLRFNNDTAGNYATESTFFSSGTVTASRESSQSKIRLNVAQTVMTSSTNHYTITVSKPTTGMPASINFDGKINNTSSVVKMFGSADWNNTSAKIDRIKIQDEDGTGVFDTGSFYILEGYVVA